MLHRIGFIILALAAMAFGLVVGTLNSDPVAIDLLWFQIDWPLGLVMLISLVLGFGLGILFTWFGTVVPMRLKMRKLRAGRNGSGHSPADGNDA